MWGHFLWDIEVSPEDRFYSVWLPSILCFNIGLRDLLTYSFDVYSFDVYSFDVYSFDVYSFDVYSFDVYFWAGCV